MLEVIGAGFGRTGTLSLKVALERLGFGPCYHAVEAMKNPRHVPLWEAAFDGRPDWDTLFGDYRSTTDWPAVAVWRSLVDAFPAAKVVLTVRDPHRWYASVSDTVLSDAGADGAPGFLADTGMPPEEAERLGRFIGRMIGSQPLHDEAAAVEWFEEHVREVRAYVPAERLLVFEVAQGWTPLCEFLGVGVPDRPFPHLNDAEAFNELIPRLVRGED